MPHVEPSHPSYRDAPPKLIGGARCLDFLNTVEWRGDPAANGERFTDYGEFAAWCLRAGLAGARAAAAMRRLAARSPAKARAALEDVRALRDAIAAMMMRRPSAIGDFNTLLRRLDIAFELAERDDGLQTVPVERGDVLRAPLAHLALDAIALVTSERLALVRNCGNDRCGWFFLDLSRNKSRRWCDMAACGNNAKARAHYHRHHS
jgi:predicted RNA-binding Zn ribbon-like protein